MLYCTNATNGAHEGPLIPYKQGLIVPYDLDGFDEFQIMG